MPASAAGRAIDETRTPGGVPLFLHRDWAARFPGVVAGTTGSDDDGSFDLGLFGHAPAGEVTGRWRALLREAGFPAAVHSRQAHGSLVQTHDRAHEGLLLSDGYDGHATAQPGLLLTISVADCVPVFLADPDAGAVSLLHAGWRGVAADVLEAGLASLRRLADTRADRVWMHTGPAICGECYEVGPEVHEAVGLPRPESNTNIDLRRVLGERAARLGIRPERVSVSRHCTRCGPGRFFSHRGGQRGRQMAVIGVLPELLRPARQQANSRLLD